MSNMQTVAVIRQISRYPVKSMKGQVMPSTELTLQGLPEDRRYAFVQAGSRSAFPWLTARELPEMLSYGTYVEGSGTPQVAVAVMTPEGSKLPVDSHELRQDLETRSGRKIFLLRDYRGCYDVANVSLISLQTVTRIAEETETPEDSRRFRPNLLIDVTEGEAFDELKWVGKIIRVGDQARIAVTEVDQRCMMITLHPDTGTANPSVLKCVVQQHGKSAGIYGTVVTPGEVKDGDPILLEG